MRRRRFLGVSAAALVGTACGSRDAEAGASAGSAASAAGAGHGGGGEEAVPGVQLYTLRSLMEQNVAGTLRQVSEIGYREVEFAGLWGLDPQEMRGLLDESGLRAPSTHVPLERVRSDLEGVLREAEALGHRWVVVPWLGEGDRTVEGYRGVARTLNEAGAAGQGAGVHFGYHNHGFEFDDLGGGTTGMDLLLAETDPDVVGLQMDLFWAVDAGHDPLPWFRDHPGRFVSVHVKDRAADGSMVDVGEGAMEFPRLLAAAAQAGVRHYFVEHDRPDDPAASVARSYRGLVAALPGRAAP